MPLTINKVYPWGRSFAEYVRMFALSADDLSGRILGCGDGPASFNAEATAHGHRVVSIDPVYRFNADEIQRRVEETSPEIVRRMVENPERFVWTHFDTPEAVADARLSAMRGFAADYETGRHEGRYLEASLPRLPLADGAFDLALSSHFVFLYSDELSYAFHLEAIREMCRVAREARVFPLLDMQSRVSAHLEPVTEQLTVEGYTFERRRVDYEFQKGANEMLVVRPPTKE
jgi:hypothetical protein